MTALCFALALSGCKSPFNRTEDASGGGPTGQFGQAPAYVIFSSELVSGGGAFLYPGGENQSLTFDDRSNAISQRSIRYSWNGRPAGGTVCPSPATAFDFAGVDLMHTPLQSQFSSTPGRDLRQAGYTKVTFYARGSLSTNTYLKVEAASPGVSDPCVGVVSPCVKLISGSDPDPTRDSTCATLQLAGPWNSYTISGIANSDLAAVKDLFKATFVFVQPFPGNQAPGQGGAAYFDRIQYEP